MVRFYINYVMKKSVFIILIMLFVCIDVYADNTQTCKVKGTDGSVEVSIMTTDGEKGICVLSMSNDTDKNVNIRYTIKCGTQTRHGSALVYANSESTRQIKFDPTAATKNGNVTITSLSGERCE